MDAIIEIRGLSKRFGDKEVFKELNFSIKKGECLAVIGTSGCGKTTLLRLIMGLLPPDSGRVVVLGKDIFDLDPFELNELRANLGMIFQTSALFDFLTVGENVAFFLKEHTAFSSDRIEARAQEMLKAVGLEGTEHLMPFQISEGMKKRVALARALIYSPKILLYDEPTAGLDPLSSSNIVKLMGDIHNARKITSIIATHRIEDILPLAERVVLLKDGRIKELDSSWKVKIPHSLGDFLKLFNKEVNNEKEEISD